jgi:hypothetical protein
MLCFLERLLWHIIAFVKNLFLYNPFVMYMNREAMLRSLASYRSRKEQEEKDAAARKKEAEDTRKFWSLRMEGLRASEKRLSDQARLKHQEEYGSDYENSFQALLDFKIGDAEHNNTDTKDAGDIREILPDTETH